LEVKPNKTRSISKKIFQKIIRGILDKYQFFKLKKCIKHAYNNSPFYNKLFKENNLKPSDIKSFSDMIKIPYTEPVDLQNNPKSFFSVPKKDLLRFLPLQVQQVNQRKHILLQMILIKL